MSGEDLANLTVEYNHAEVYTHTVRADQEHLSPSTSKIIEIINLDEESSHQTTQSNNDNMIDITQDVKPNKKLNSCAGYYEDIYKENKLLSKFIEDCINLEHSAGMSLVINNTLIPLFKKASESFKKSDKFNRTLNRAAQSLERDPDHKYSHIQMLCNMLKNDTSSIKRIKPITLATNSEVNSTTLNMKRKNDFSQRISKKPKTIAIIDLDVDPPEAPSLDNDHISQSRGSSKVCTDPTLISNFIFKAYRNCVIKGKVEKPKTVTVIDLDEEPNDIPIISLDDNQSDVEKAEKDNKDSLSRKNNEHVGPQTDISLEPDKAFEQTEESRDNKLNEHNDNRLLVPEVEIIWEPSTNTNAEQNTVTEVSVQFENDIDAARVKKIEEEIKFYSNVVEKLENAEVDTDTCDSPYIQCEKAKCLIVTLYKELCLFTGNEPVKRRNVRLQALEGHPQGPVKRLEEFINDNIQDNGDPLFPDFHDVLECVKKAIKEDGLGWSKPQIMKEAISLFTQCGRALQKSRQRREWRDMMSLLRTQDDEDPALENPELMARLQDNRRRALSKETKLLERYSLMQNLPPGMSMPGPSSESMCDLPVTSKLNPESESTIQDILGKSPPRWELGKQEHKISITSIPSRKSESKTQESQATTIISQGSTMQCIPTTLIPSPEIEQKRQEDRRRTTLSRKPESNTQEILATTVPSPESMTQGLTATSMESEPKRLDIASSTLRKTIELNADEILVTSIISSELQQKKQNISTLNESKTQHLPATSILSPHSESMIQGLTGTSKNIREVESNILAITPKIVSVYTIQDQPSTSMESGESEPTVLNDSSASISSLKSEHLPVTLLSEESNWMENDLGTISCPRSEHFEDNSADTFIIPPKYESETENMDIIDVANKSLSINNDTVDDDPVENDNELSDNKVCPVVPVKKEPLETIRELESLTEFTCKIIDIEDPFLVIEISSDGSDYDFADEARTIKNQGS